jgi:hypothetical protein
MLPYFLADSSALKKDKLDNVRCYFEGFFEGHTKVLSFSGETPNPSAFPGLKPWEVVQHIFKAAL